VTAGSMHADRLLLRRFDAGDISHLIELDADPEVMRYLTGGIATERSAIEQEILPLFIDAHRNDPPFGFWAAEEDGRFVGWLSLRPVPDTGSVASLGYRFMRRAWGRGLATEGAHLLIDAGFERSSIKRIVATTYEENRPSIRVLERLGMRLKRRFRYSAADLAGSETSRPSKELWPGDDLEFALDRQDWISSRA